MQITFFHWNKCAPSIVRSFRPLIDKLMESESVEEYYVPYAGSLPWNVIRNIFFVFLHRNKKGVNHVTGDIHYCILGLIGVKSILTIHDDYAMIMAHKGFLDRIAKFILWFAAPIKMADRVLCISDATKDKVDKIVGNNKTQIFTHHVVSDGFSISHRPINKRKPVILQIGTTPHKNLETTMYALASSNYYLRVIKEMTDDQVKIAEELNLEYENIYDLSDEEMFDQYEKADVVVFPSLFEGFGMPIIEAQACGKPVITSNISPMSWVAGEGALLLNDPKNVNELRRAIDRIIMDDDYRSCLRMAGLLNVQRFNLEKTVEKYLELCRNIK